MNGTPASQRISDREVTHNRVAPAQPIRVLHSVGHLLRGGIEMWLYQVLQRLDASNFEHHVLVRTEKKEPFTEDFQRAGFRVLPCLNYNNPVKYRANLGSIIQQNGPYDVLHVHGSNPNGLLALLFAKSLGIPATIVHSHNDVRPLLKSRGVPYRIYVQLTLQGLKRFADRGFAVSSLAAESMFGSDWNTDERWQLLQPGVDFQPFEQQSDSDLRESLGIHHDSFVIGHVGRFHDQKNHLFLLQIMEDLSKKCPEAQLLLIGDGPLRSNIVAEVEQRRLQENVKFVPDTLSVPQFMLEIMDCFVLPSRYEGLGLVAVEAQAAGLPCVLSDRVPKEAVVDTNLAHFLRLEDSPVKWADEILQLRGKRIHVTKEHLQQFYASEFNLARSAEVLGSTYASLAGRRRTKAAEVNLPQPWNKAS